MEAAQNRDLAVRLGLRVEPYRTDDGVSRVRICHDAVVLAEMPPIEVRDWLEAYAAQQRLQSATRTR